MTGATPAERLIAVPLRSRCRTPTGSNGGTRRRLQKKALVTAVELPALDVARQSPVLTRPLLSGEPAAAADMAAIDPGERRFRRPAFRVALAGRATDGSGQGHAAAFFRRMRLPRWWRCNCRQPRCSTAACQCHRRWKPWDRKPAWRMRRPPPTGCSAGRLDDFGGKNVSQRQPASPPAVRGSSDDLPVLAGRRALAGPGVARRRRCRRTPRARV